LSNPHAQSGWHPGRLVTEVDLSKHMFEAGREHSEVETFAAIAQQVKVVFPIYDRLEDGLPAVMEGNTIPATEGKHPAGSLTKIDMLDFIAGKNLVKGKSRIVRIG
jgi:hypothetical protein